MNKYHCIVGNHDTEEPQAAKIEDAACCIPCATAHNHFGKFERYADRDEDPDLANLGTVLILYHWMLDGDEDDHMSSEGWGYCGMFGKYLLTEDDRGFVEYEEFDDVAAAQKRFDELYSDGWGATEDDIYVQFDNRAGGWSAYESGKEIDVTPNHEGAIPRERVLAAVSLHMRKTGYFPSIWEVGERGDIREIGSEVW